MARVSVIVGSVNDKKWALEAAKVFDEFEIEYELKVLSAHRTPEALVDYIKNNEKNTDVFIAMAGYAAHLAGVIAAHTTKPVLGVPIASSPLSGFDSLLSMVQMPSGIPVATFGVNGAKNAALFALSIISLSDREMEKKLKEYREKMARKVLESSL